MLPAHNGLIVGSNPTGSTKHTEEEGNIMRYDDNCTVINSNNGVEIDAYVSDYRPEKYLTVIVNGVKLKLQWNIKRNRFIGKMAGLDFESFGPKSY